MNVEKDKQLESDRETEMKRKIKISHDNTRAESDLSMLALCHISDSHTWLIPDLLIEAGYLQV